ncbi:MAG: acetoacetate--CoA ligase [Gammaproteobacteria bacterium]
MSIPIWRPTPERVQAANLTRFIADVRDRYAPSVHDYPSLYAWSIARPAEFWPAVWAYCGVRASRPWDTVLEHPGQLPGARWFTGARLNFSENLLRRRDEHPALLAFDERGPARRLSYGALYAEVAQLSKWLKQTGVQPGDRVAGYLPNIPESVVAMLATASIGAIWSSCSPDFGLAGLLDRFGQIRPKVLFTADGYYYKGKRLDCLERVQQAVPRLATLRRVVLVPHTGPAELNLSIGVRYPDVLAEAPAAEIDYAQLPFDHPLYILYSSGTTGVPKCIVHGAGGTLLQHLKELVLHTDLRADERIFYFTTCGWMMWNWLVSALAVGATLVLYEGSPFHPKPEILLDLADQAAINVFGTSAKYLSGLEKAGVQPRATHDLRHLRTILSTGSPLAPESYDYVYRHVKSDVLLASISGGTDIVSCFALGNPCLPVYRGELQCRGLGMKVEIYNDAGQPIVGEKGELVCTAPFPSMPVGFWNDADGSAYRAAYFQRFPGAWAHGDYAELTAQGGVIIHGRSDAVLNPGGVRIGTAEIYRPLEALPEVLEGLAVGQARNDDVRIILFVKLKEGLRLDEALTRRIRETIRTGASPRHVPAQVIQVPDLPRTRSGKLVEVAVRETIHGRPVRNLEALANPEVLRFFKVPEAPD